MRLPKLLWLLSHSIDLPQQTIPPCCRLCQVANIYWQTNEVLPISAFDRDCKPLINSSWLGSTSRGNYKPLLTRNRPLWVLCCRLLVNWSQSANLLVGSQELMWFYLLETELNLQAQKHWRFFHSDPEGSFLIAFWELLWRTFSLFQGLYLLVCDELIPCNN